MASGKIKITVTNEKFFCWNAKDVIELRTKHRIVGQLSGCAIGQPNQTLENALPLELSRFETKVLLEKNLIQLNRINHSLVDAAQLAVEYKAHDDRIWEEYKTIAMDSKREKIMANAERITEGSRVGRKRRMVNDETEDTHDPEKILQEKLDKIAPMADSERPVILHSSCPFESMVQPINESIALKDQDQMSYKVFEHLYNQGFYLTSGFKFAVDFLAYERDPFIAHAKYMIMVKPQSEQQQLLAHGANFTAIELLIKARLSTQVKKKLMIATIDDDDKVQFVSINWKGRQFRHPKPPTGIF